MSRDVVRMPERHRFASLEWYYSTLWHELMHWTGHRDRLARPQLEEMAPLGTPLYSKEELTAEMGAGFLCSILGIENTFDQSAAYIQGWLQEAPGRP